MREIEILVPVYSSKEEAIRTLEKYPFQGERTLHDVYFMDPLRTDLQPGPDASLSGSFRVRTTEEGCWCAYKKDVFDEKGQWLYADEYETKIGDRETYVRMLQLLGFEVLVEIRNHRRIYTFEHFEIVLEDVEGLGLFLEVERKECPDDVDPVGVREEIFTFLRSLELSLGSESTSGKPELMLRARTQI